MKLSVFYVVFDYQSLIHFFLPLYFGSMMPAIVCGVVELITSDVDI